MRRHFGLRVMPLFTGSRSKETTHAAFAHTRGDPELRATTKRFEQGITFEPWDAGNPVSAAMRSHRPAASISPSCAYAAPRLYAT